MLEDLGPVMALFPAEEEKIEERLLGDLKRCQKVLDPVGCVAPPPLET